MKTLYCSILENILTELSQKRNSDFPGHVRHWTYLVRAF